MEHKVCPTKRQYKSQMHKEYEAINFDSTKYPETQQHPHLFIYNSIYQLK